MHQHIWSDNLLFKSATAPEMRGEFEARQVACLKGRHHLFSNIHIQLHAGHALHIRGSNGSGKSSLLRILCGLNMPAEGAVLWRGKSIQKIKEEFHQNVLFHGHANGIKDDLLAWENISFSARLVGQQVSYEEACTALEAMGVLQIAQLPARQLSQGQRKRLALARLYFPQLPELLILDEAFSALDQKSTAALATILRAHLQRGGMLIYTTHQDIQLQVSDHHELWLGKYSC